MSSETQNSSSDILPSNSVSDDKPSSAAEENPASDVKPSASNHFQDNQASDDKPSTAEDKPASDDKSSAADEDKPVSNGKPLVADENKPTPDGEPSTVDENKLVSDDKQSVVDEDQPVSDNKPSGANEHKPASDGKPLAADENKPVPDGRPSAVNENKLALDEKKSAIDEDKLTSDDKPSPTDEDKPVSDGKLSTADENKPAPNNKPSTVDENKLASNDKQSAVDEDKLASDDKPLADEENPASDDKHTRAEADLASIDKQSTADEDGTNVPSEIQQTPLDVLPSGSNEITPAEENLASHDDHTPGDDNPDAHDNPIPAEADQASLDKPPKRSKSDPIPELSKKANASSHRSNVQSLCNLIKEELKYMEDDPKQLIKYGDLIESQLKEANEQLRQLEDEINKGSDERDEDTKELRELKKHEQDEDTKELRELKKKVTKLKAKFPSKAKMHSLEKEIKKANDLKEDSHLTSIIKKRKLKLPNLYKNPTFDESETFGDFLSLFHDLDCEAKKLCLLCFAVFPEDAKIKMGVMIYWWIAEGFIASEESEEIPPEEKGQKFLQEYAEKGFIVPVPEKPGFEVHKYKLHPLARVVLITLAERARFFDFNKDGNPTEKYSSSLRSCLIGEGLSDVSQLGKLHMLFNVNEPILEFKPEWFPKMENINILYLGRWQSEEKHHIEIEDSKFLESLQYLKFLKFLSLQGVSRVTELPDSIKQLDRLMILDLRACHNLEKIPSGIGRVKNLRYLDMSDCYLIDHMPKELSSLENLLVLKGFVVGDPKETKGKKKPCTLKDLAPKLKKLKKLSIYTGFMEFPENEDLKALSDLKKLESLTIAWGSASDKSDATVKGGKDVKQQKNKNQENVRNEQVHQEEKKTSSAIASTERVKKGNLDEISGRKEKPTKGTLKRSETLLARIQHMMDPQPASSEDPPPLPGTLKKLDLKCYPHLLSPRWLKPDKLTNLNKLYIRGGRLRDLGEVYEWNDHKPHLTEKTWKQVEILRLKFLEEMEIRWKDLHHLFPNLTYLEKVNCPKLTLFPCNDSGVWINKTKIRSNQENPAES